MGSGPGGIRLASPFCLLAFSCREYSLNVLIYKWGTLLRVVAAVWVCLSKLFGNITPAHKTHHFVRKYKDRS